MQKEKSSSSSSPNQPRSSNPQGIIALRNALAIENVLETKMLNELSELISNELTCILTEQSHLRAILLEHLSAPVSDKFWCDLDHQTLGGLKSHSLEPTNLNEIDTSSTHSQASSLHQDPLEDLLCDSESFQSSSKNLNNED